MPRNHDSPARPRELAKGTEPERAGAGDRRREQARGRPRSVAHRIRSSSATTTSAATPRAGAVGEDRILDDRQARIDRQQRNRDISQRASTTPRWGATSSSGHSTKTRLRLNLPTSEQPQPANASAIHREAIRRARAARERADTALIRAEAAMVRAEDAAIRASDGDPSEN